MTATEKRIYNIFVVLLLFVFIATIIKCVPGYIDDVDFWRRWAATIEDNGLSKVYYTDPQYTYLPLFHWLLYVYDCFAGNTLAVVENINYLRLFVLAFDCFALWTVYKWLDNKIDFLPFFLINLLNVGFVYNTLIWGQVDALGASFLMATMYYLWKQKYLLSCVCLVVAINFKFQSLIFLPVWGLLFLQDVIKQKAYTTIIWAVITVVVVQLIILLPFIADPYSLKTIWNVIFNSVDKYPRVSLNAMNFWYLILNGDLFYVPDANEFLFGLSYKKAGLLMFMLSYFVILFPLIRSFFSRNLHNKVSKEQIWIMCSLVALSFFYFNTQMHERYSLPAFIFIIAYAFSTKDFVPYILISVACFLNHEKVLRVLSLSNYDTAVFSPKFMSILFTLLIIYLFIRLYKKPKPV